MTKKACEQCAYWNCADRHPEQFSVCWGKAVYHIDEAKKIVRDGREAYDCSIDKLKVFVNVNPGTIDLSKVSLDSYHMRHVPMDDPIILAYELKSREKTHHPRQLIVIDG